MRGSLLYLCLFFLNAGFALAQDNHKGAEPYAAGFRTIHVTDSSRIYRADSPESDSIHFRPLDIDIWYPAIVNKDDRPVQVSRLLELVDARTNFYTGSTAGNGASIVFAKAFCEGYKCSDSARLLKFPTRSFDNAPMAKGRFPLVIYLASYGSMCFENYTLMESLAMKGYLVMSINSIGRFPGDMTTLKEDLFEQVNDAGFSYQTILGRMPVDTGKVALVGYSWGGLTSVLTAARIPHVKCMVSWEGSEFHHYGQKDPDAAREDSNYNDLVNTSEFKNRSLKIPYLRFESGGSGGPDEFDSVYQFGAKLDQKIILTVEGANHGDFSCLGPVVRASGNCPDDHKYATVLALTESYIDEKLKGKGSFNSRLLKFGNIVVEKK